LSKDCFEVNYIDSSMLVWACRYMSVHSCINHSLSLTLSLGPPLNAYTKLVLYGSQNFDMTGTN